MATTNPFDLLGDDDTEDPWQIIATKQFLKKAGPLVPANPAQKQLHSKAAPSARMPAKPLPPAQAKEPEAKKSEGGEYGMLLDEKKALQALTTGERRVYPTEFESMQQLSKKSNEDIFTKLSSEKDKRGEAFDNEEKVNKAVNINELFMPAEGEGYYIPGGCYRGRDCGSRGDCARSAATCTVAIEGHEQLPSLDARGGGGKQETTSSRVNGDEEEKGQEVSSMVKQREELNGSVVTRLETAESLDWRRLMAEDPNFLFSVEKSPVKYFMDEMSYGNSLRNTTTLGNEKERERVYDTIFRLPWRCELLINVGLFVCLDSFLSLVTITLVRMLMAFWRLMKTRQFKRLSGAELCDFGCFVALACGVTLLGQTDISLIYHMIRGQGTIKLYVVYNVLEIFDKLCQSFIGDVLQTMFNSAERFARASPENLRFWLWRFICDLLLAAATSIVHSFILLAQAITLSTCIVAHNNSLLALLVSNNFAEIKSNVFKRFSKDNVHSIVYYDSVERFHISAFLLFVLAQNLLEAEGPWFDSFLFNALLVYFSEMAIDIIKHSFIAKFNDIKPTAYSEFLEDLCKQTLNIQTDDKKNLTFVPLAPACVVFRVLTPVYAAHIPHSSLPWRLFCVLISCTLTFVMLASLKVMIGMGLQKHATWYVNRCRTRKHHLHAD